MAESEQPPYCQLCGGGKSTGLGARGMGLAHLCSFLYHLGTSFTLCLFSSTVRMGGNNTSQALQEEFSINHKVTWMMGVLAISLSHLLKIVETV